MNSYRFNIGKLYKEKIVATGVWLCDKTDPRKIEITARPARFASSRFDDNDQLDETRLIPVNADWHSIRLAQQVVEIYIR